jgi:hypothetical protein
MRAPRTNCSRQRRPCESRRREIAVGFVGLSEREAAEALGVTERTIERHWAYAKVWLLREIRTGT